jgi:hypothetical protein
MIRPLIVAARVTPGLKALDYHVSEPWQELVQVRVEVL